jgi:hypothetical protein
MALGTITVTNDLRKSASAPLGQAELSFPGDGAYPAGGTPSFESLVRTAMGRDVDVLCVTPCGVNGGKLAIYDKANDKLYIEDGAGTEESGNLSTTTFKLIVSYQ